MVEIIGWAMAHPAEPALHYITSPYTCVLNTLGVK